MNYRDLLHKPFKQAGQVFTAIMDAFTVKYEQLVEQIYTTINEYSLTTATGEALDKWGRDFDISRGTDDDTAYRTRLIKFYRGLGVTKNYLIELGNQVLAKYSITCSITEWFEQNSGLNKYEFKVNTEIPLSFGYTIGKSGIGIQDVSYKGSTIITIRNYYLNYIFPELKKVIERYRASGTKALYTIGGYNAE